MSERSKREKVGLKKSKLGVIDKGEKGEDESGQRGRRWKRRTAGDGRS